MDSHRFVESSRSKRRRPDELSSSLSASEELLDSWRRKIKIIVDDIGNINPEIKRAKDELVAPFTDMELYEEIHQLRQDLIDNLTTEQSLREQIQKNAISGVSTCNADLDRELIEISVRTLRTREEVRNWKLKRPPNEESNALVAWEKERDRSFACWRLLAEMKKAMSGKRNTPTSGLLRGIQRTILYKFARSAGARFLTPAHLIISLGLIPYRDTWRI